MGETDDEIILARDTNLELQKSFKLKGRRALSLQKVTHLDPRKMRVLQFQAFQKLNFLFSRS